MLEHVDQNPGAVGDDDLIIQSPHRPHLQLFYTRKNTLTADLIHHARRCEQLGNSTCLSILFSKGCGGAGVSSSTTCSEEQHSQNSFLLLSFFFKFFFYNAWRCLFLTCICLALVLFSSYPKPKLFIKGALFSLNLNTCVVSRGLIDTVFWEHESWKTGAMGAETFHLAVCLICCFVCHCCKMSITSNWLTLSALLLRLV